MAARHAAPARSSRPVRQGLLAVASSSVLAAAATVVLLGTPTERPAPTALAVPASVPAATPIPSTSTTKPVPVSAAPKRPATPATTRPKRTKVALRCAPAEDAKMEDPSRPSVITNKDCPKLIKAKESSQREFARQRERRWYGPSDPGAAALQACREQTGQTNAECRAQSASGLAN